MSKFDPAKPSDSQPRPNGPRGKEWVLALFLIFAAIMWVRDWMTPDRNYAAAPPPVQHHSLAGAATAN
jgi:hypothetical protein